MELLEGRTIALAVDTKWYEALQLIGIMKPGLNNPFTATLVLGTIASSEQSRGLWIRATRSSEYPHAPLFVPWGHIIAATLTDRDDEKKMIGFVQAQHPEV